MKIEVVYTQTFERLLDYLISYLSDFSDEVSVIERVEEVIERFESIISVDPFAVSVSTSLLELGITDFREFHANNFRILYRIKDERVVVDLIAQQKQDLEQLLVHYCLLLKA